MAQLWLLAALWSPVAQAQEAPEAELEEATEPVGLTQAELADLVRIQLEAAQRQLDAQTDLIQAQSALMDEQQEALEHLTAQITDVKLKMIPPDKFTFDIEGSYRTRAYVFPNLFNEKVKGVRDARYIQSRLRLRPVFNYKDLAKLKFQVNGMHDALWGDNASQASTAVFANDPSLTGLSGHEVPSLYLSRAWLEFSVPVGLIRVGRQPSHWGLGLLANDGDGFKNTFGEATTQGNTFDRAIFATKPIAIAQTIAGTGDSGIPLYFAVGVDRLVEDPLIQFYGYKCEPFLVDGVDEDFDPRCDINDDGTSDLEHGLTDESRTADQRGLDWWADQDDDVMEMIYVLIYRGEDVDYFGGTGDLTAGFYAINRTQRETDSNVVILDAYLDAKVHGVVAQFEGVHIRGKTRGVALPGSFDPSGDGDPLAKTASITGYVARAGYEQAAWSVLGEAGYASGDNNVADEDFTGRPLHADHNAGLLLYEEVISRVTANAWGSGAQGLWSNGGVYNSHYIFPHASVWPLDNWEFISGFLMAWPDKPDGAIILCADGEDCAQTDATASTLGWELDFGVHHQFHEHLLFAMETGYAHATDRLPLENAGLNPKGNFFTFQSRIAWQF
jgi:hypothetical protein